MKIAKILPGHALTKGKSKVKGFLPCGLILVVLTYMCLTILLAAQKIIDSFLVAHKTP